MQIFDISTKGKVCKVYSFEEIVGGNSYISKMVSLVSLLETGRGAVTYNLRRNMLGAIPIANKVAYHLFTVDTHTSNALNIIKLSCKRSSHASNSAEIILSN